MAALLRLRYFFSYWLNAVDEHSLHSPFYYDLYTNLVKKDDTLPYKAIELERKKLLRDRTPIDIHDLGAGSQNSKSSTKLICDIARTSLSRPKFSRLYQRFSTHFNAKIIVELGTSLGINSLYLARTKNSSVYTFEGAPALASLANRIFELAGANNIKLIEGDIEKTLPNFLTHSMKIDLAFIDANHRYLPTKHYFEWLLPHMHAKSLIILDDIYYSEEMKKAWEEIKRHKLVYATVDLFRCGVVFFDPSLNKQNVVLQY